MQRVELSVSERCIYLTTLSVANVITSVVNESSMIGWHWWNNADTEILKYSEKTPLHFHLVHHKSNID